MPHRVRSQGGGEVGRPIGPCHRIAGAVHHEHLDRAVPPELVDAPVFGRLRSPIRVTGRVHSDHATPGRRHRCPDGQGVGSTAQSARMKVSGVQVLPHHREGGHAFGPSRQITIMNDMPGPR